MQTNCSNDSDFNDRSGFFRSRETVLTGLRIVLALQCLGVAGRLLFSSMESESQIFEYLFFELGVAENTAQMIDDIGAYGCLAAALVFLIQLLISAFKPNSKTCSAPKWSRIIESMTAVFVSLWCTSNAVSHSLRGELYSELTLGEVAVRIACPIVLILSLQAFSHSSQSVTRGTKIAKWLIVIAISLTFSVHGYKAIQLYGPFVDLILLSDLRIFHLDWEQETAEGLLLVIGWIDILLALALLFTRSRAIVIYMLIWGLITATSRMTALGSTAWPETIVRAANWGAPWVLLMIWRSEKKKID